MRAKEVGIEVSAWGQSERRGGLGVKVGDEGVWGNSGAGVLAAIEERGRCYKRLGPKLAPRVLGAKAGAEGAWGQRMSRVGRCWRSVVATA